MAYLARSGIDADQWFWKGFLTGQDDFNPHSSFYDERELRALFPGFEEQRFFAEDLKYYPLPWGRDWLARRFGFFLTMTARKRAAAPVG